MYSSKVLSLVFALCISFFTTLLVWVVGSVANNGLWITGLISFSIAYVFAFTFLEIFIFGPIDKIKTRIDGLKENVLYGSGKQKTNSSNPLNEISEDIYSIAQQKQLEIERLKMLEAFRKEFIADVSHELKTPIFAAQGFIHTLIDGAVKDKTVRGKFLKKAARSLDGLDALVQDLLTLSNIETGQIKMHFENIDLYMLSAEVLEQLEDKAEKRSIKLKIDSPRQKVMVHADSQRISQVMTNLVSNGIKHSADGGEVVVSFDLSKNNVHVHVRDFGEGIAAEHVSRIFERFYRIDKSRSREKGGTGLGLAIVKHILENHGTKAEVESIPNKGSDFSFKLPRAKEISL